MEKNQKDKKLLSSLRRIEEKTTPRKTERLAVSRKIFTLFWFLAF